MEWQEFTHTVHAPANAATLEIRLTVSGATGQTVWFDGIRLKVPGLEGVYDFTGKREDEGTGLLYFAARWYDPETCRFVTRDTVWGNPGVPGTLNLFAYCLNNPLGMVDPTGHKSKSYSAQANIGKETATRGEGWARTTSVYSDAQGNYMIHTKESRRVSVFGKTLFWVRTRTTEEGYDANGNLVFRGTYGLLTGSCTFYLNNLSEEEAQAIENSVIFRDYYTDGLYAFVLSRFPMVKFSQIVVSVANWSFFFAKLGNDLNGKKFAPRAGDSIVMTFQFLVNGDVHQSMVLYGPGNKHISDYSFTFTRPNPNRIGG